MHAVDQLLAAAVQPLGAAKRGRVGAKAAGFAGAVVAEIVVGIELMGQLAHRQLDHHRVVEEAQHLHRIRDDVVRIGEIRQRRQHALAVGFRHRPRVIAHHRDHVVQAQQALADEIRQLGLLRIVQQGHGGGHDFLGTFALDRLA